MFDEAILRCKESAAQVAAHLFLPAEVDQHVRLEVGLVPEAFGANEAREGPHVCVNAQVGQNIARLAELLQAVQVGTVQHLLSFLGPGQLLDIAFCSITCDHMSRGLTVVTLVLRKGYLERLNFVGLEGLGCLVSNNLAREFHGFWVVSAVDVVEAQVDGLTFE